MRLGIIILRCNNPRCGRTWRTRLVNEPGKGQLLALVMEEF